MKNSLDGNMGGGVDRVSAARKERAELDKLGDDIAELSARIQAAMYQLLVMIAEFDRREGWDGGFLSCAHWLNWRTGLALGTAREWVRVARALTELPLISKAMSQGQISYSKVRALTRVATPKNEERLLDFALAGNASHVEKLCRAWRRVDRIAEAEQDERRLASRSLVLYDDEDGMVVVRGRLDPETGAVLRRALDAAADKLFRDARQAEQDASDAQQAQEQPQPPSTSRSKVPIEHRRVDALALVAECALASELDPGTSSDRYQVVIHVDADVLRDVEPDQSTPSNGVNGHGRSVTAAHNPDSADGISMIEDGANLSAQSARRLTCDGPTVTMSHDGDGNVLDVGRKSRTISPALRRALRFRDSHCRFPGCGVTFCEGHHVQHWADGGETKLDNLILLCRRHHRAVHEGGYRVELLPDGEVRFFNHYGVEVKDAPPQPSIDHVSARQLDDFAEPHGQRIGPWTGSATCDNTPLDYGYALDVMRIWEREESDVEGEDGGAGRHGPDGDVPAGTSDAQAQPLDNPANPTAASGPPRDEPAPNGLPGHVPSGPPGDVPAGTSDREHGPDPPSHEADPE